MSKQESDKRKTIIFINTINYGQFNARSTKLVTEAGLFAIKGEIYKLYLNE